MSNEEKKEHIDAIVKCRRGSMVDSQFKATVEYNLEAYASKRLSEVKERMKDDFIGLIVRNCLGYTTERDENGETHQIWQLDLDALNKQLSNK